jgi:putative membrane fusion protein
LELGEEMAIKNKFKFFRFILIVSLIFYFIYRFLIGYFVADEVTYIAKFDQMYLENEYNGFIIRNEKIFKSDINGGIEYKINDGDVVKKGQVIAEIENTSNNNEINEVARNEEINRVLLREKLLKETDEEIITIKDKISIAAQEGNVNQINQLENELISRLDYQDKLKNTTIENFNLEEISNRNQLGQENNYFYSNYSGIVSRKFDGMEKLLNIANLYMLDYNDIINSDITVENKISGDLKSGENVYKIIDNYVYYLVYSIPLEDIKLFKNTLKDVIVEIGQEKLTANIYDCFEKKNNGILVLEVNETYKGFYEDRKIQNVIKSDKFKGLKIHNDSIVTIDNTKGVFRMNRNFEPEFIPVSILNSFDEFTIVVDGYFYRYENDSREKVMTIDVNDEIYRNGINYIEN